MLALKITRQFEAGLRKGFGTVGEDGEAITPDDALVALGGLDLSLHHRQQWFYQVNVWLDPGFQGAEKDYGAKSKIHLPHKRPKKSKNNPKPKLTSAQVKHNRRMLEPAFP